MLCPTCEQTQQWCITCDQLLPLDQFALARKRRTGRSTHCKKCFGERYWASALAVRNARYGLTAEKYEELLAEQDGRCAICRREPTGRQGLCTDHCHATGQVRGLLCVPCNTTLGNMKDDPALLRVAAEYLDRWVMANA